MVKYLVREKWEQPLEGGRKSRQKARTTQRWRTGGGFI